MIDPAWFFTGWPRSLEIPGRTGITVMQYSVETGIVTKLPHLDVTYVKFGWGIRNERANELARSLIATSYNVVARSLLGGVPVVDQPTSDVVEAVVHGLVEGFPSNGMWAISDLQVRQIADPYVISWLRNRL